MRMNRLFMMMIWFFVLFSQCAKKEREDEVVVIQPETVEIDVDVPQTQWEKSIAVLPLKSADISLNRNYLADLVSNRFYSDLSRIQKLKVYSPTTAELVRPNILDADFVLTTNIVEKGEAGEGDISIEVQLFNAENDTNTNTEIYHETFRSLFAVEEGAAKTIAAKLGYRIDQDRMVSLEMSSPQIRKLYLDAQALRFQQSRESTDQAIQKYKEVLRLDSTYTLAWLGLAESYLQIVRHRWDRNLVWQRLAHEASLKAIQYDSTQPDGYLMLGQVYMFWGDFKKAEETFRNVLKINNNLPSAWTGLGQIYAYYGLYRASLEVFHKALSLKPDDVHASLSYAMILIGLKRYEEGEKIFRQILDIHPEEKYFHSFLALALLYQDKLSGAMNEIQQGLQSDVYQAFSHAVLGMIYAKQKQLDEALGEVELEVKPYVGNNASLATAVAAVYALLQREGLAVQWIEKAIAFGYREYPWVMNDPNFKNLHGDERFDQLMEKMKENWIKNMELYNTGGSA